MEHLIDRMEKEYTAELQVGGLAGWVGEMDAAGVSDHAVSAG